MADNSLIKKLEPADILLVSEKGAKHSINRTIGRSKWHHVMLYIGKGKVLEVTPRKGCHISVLDLTKNCFLGYKAIRNTTITEKQKKKIVAEAIKFHGRKFSWRQLGKAFLRRIIDPRSNGKRKLRPYPAQNHYAEKIICSNLVAIAYHREGYLISERHKPEHIMPRDYDKTKDFKVIFERKPK